MTRPAESLDLIQIASPCHVSWDEMQGDNRVRFCGQCKLHVYDLSQMNRSDAQQFIRQREGRTCVRFFRRRDSTILTRDCPRGLRVVRQRLVRAAAALAALFVALFTTALFAGLQKRSGPNGFRCTEPFFARWIRPQPEIELFMGDVLVPLRPSNPPASEGSVP
jgi:hypothetical protein